MVQKKRIIKATPLKWKYKKVGCGEIRQKSIFGHDKDLIWDECGMKLNCPLYHMCSGRVAYILRLVNNGE